MNVKVQKQLDRVYEPTTLITITRNQAKYYYLHFYVMDVGHEPVFQYDTGALRTYERGDFRWEVSRRLNNTDFLERGYKNILILDKTENHEFTGFEWEIVIANKEKGAARDNLKKVSPVKHFPVDDLQKDAIVISLVRPHGRPCFYLGSYVVGKAGYTYIRQWGPYNEELSDEETNDILNEIVRSEWFPQGFDNLVLMDCTPLRSHLTKVYEIAFDGYVVGDKDADAEPIYKAEPEPTAIEKLLSAYKKHAEKVLKETINSMHKGIDPIRMSGDIMQALADVHRGMGMVAVEKDFLDKEKDKDKETKKE